MCVSPGLSAAPLPKVVLGLLQASPVVLAPRGVVGPGWRPHKVWEWESVSIFPRHARRTTPRLPTSVHVSRRCAHRWSLTLFPHREIGRALRPCPRASRGPLTAPPEASGESRGCSGTVTAPRVQPKHPHTLADFFFADSGPCNPVAGRRLKKAYQNAKH